MIKEKNFTKIELGENTNLVLCNSDATIFDNIRIDDNDPVEIMSVIDDQGSIRTSVEYWNVDANFANTMSLAV